LDDQEGQVEVLQNGVDDRGCGISEVVNQKEANINQERKTVNML
jgi:hypothetical protein